MPSTKPGTPVLLAEDDPVTAIRLTAGLQANGFIVSSVTTVAAAKEIIQQNQIQLLVLDIYLDDGMSLPLIELARQKNIGILCVSNAADLDDRLTALRLGADDYVAKPVSNSELALKLQNLLIRIQQADPSHQSSLYRFGEFEVEPSSQKIKKGEKQISCTPGEFDILFAFLKRPKQILNRERLMQLLSNPTQSDRAIDIMVHKIRQKIEKNPKHPDILKTIYGNGYLFDCDVEVTYF